jgi:hypothetical protein
MPDLGKVMPDAAFGNLPAVFAISQSVANHSMSQALLPNSQS